MIAAVVVAAVDALTLAAAVGEIDVIVCSNFIYLCSHEFSRSVASRPVIALALTFHHQVELENGDQVERLFTFTSSN